MLDILIKGGQVVTPQGVGQWDITIQGEHIAAVAHAEALGAAESHRTIDAQGEIVVPGGVECHAHLQHSIAGKPHLTTQTTLEGTRAAAFGGTTTLIDFAFQLPDVLPLEAVQRRQELFRGNSYIDYAFHCALTGDIPFEAMEQIPTLISQGVPSFKIYTTYGRPYRDPPTMVDLGHLWGGMTQVAQHQGIVVCHAEEDEIIRFMVKKLKREGRAGAENIHLARNKLSEDMAFRKVIRLAQHAGCGLVLLHMTAQEGMAAIREARAQGLPVYGEVLHNYLCFTCEDSQKPQGAMYHTYPFLKYPEDRDALWEGVLKGLLSIASTDDATTSLEVKLSGKTIEDAVGGHNGLETRLPILFSEGVMKRQMTLQQFANATATNPARILGMYPQKGIIAPGSDADIVIIDPSVRKQLRKAELHDGSDYTIWEGWDVQGYPVMTLLRGKVIVEDGRLLGSPEDGHFLPRKIQPEVLNTPIC